MKKEVKVLSVQFSSEVTFRVFDESPSSTECSHNGPQAESAPAEAASSIARSGGISQERRVHQRTSIAAVLSFQNYLRRHSTDPSTHPSLLRCVSSKFSQRARDIGLEQGRLLFCEVYKPVKGSAPTIPLPISKYPSLKRKSHTRYGTETQGQPEQKKQRCVTMD